MEDFNLAKFFIEILGPDDDYRFVSKHFSQINTLPPIGLSVYFDGWEMVGDVVSATVTGHRLILFEGKCSWRIECTLDSDEDKQAFTEERGWNLNDIE